MFRVCGFKVHGIGVAVGCARPTHLIFVVLSTCLPDQQFLALIWFRMKVGVEVKLDTNETYTHKVVYKN